ncbi:hypothetical protein BST28_17475 [Mycolicibacter kumamotonensis]|uniref:Uncharacterized protein n=2 Tax=Mycolicibacter kumamotonensis TaxID=354243 RepID=A0A1X0DYS2_9MYCO|nr:hypothetical protein BST28_17475 [Mycolicibacter kumamotonensis]
MIRAAMHPAVVLALGTVAVALGVYAATHPLTVYVPVPELAVHDDGYNVNASGTAGLGHWTQDQLKSWYEYRSHFGQGVLI